MKMFYDRAQAGQKLAQKIQSEFNFDCQNTIILALPRGGVVVAFEMAKILKLPLDIIVTRKIGHPFNQEYAIAAVSAHEIILGKQEEVDRKYLDRQTRIERQEIARRMRKYRKGKKYPELKGKIVILVDDGLATGLTMEAAILEVKFLKAAEIILAVPVAPPSTVWKLEPLVDKIIVLEIEPNFFAVGGFYQNFAQVTDQQVISLLNLLNRDR